MKFALITGAAGFIGHYLVKEFSKDYGVIACIRPNGNTKRLHDLDLDILIHFFHDIRDPFKFKFDLDAIELVLHAGGNPSSELSISDPVSVVKDNVIGTANMLEFARKLPNLKRFVYYGAAESYGPSPIGTDKKEDDSYDSVSPYAASKAAGAELCVSYSKTFGLPVSIINIANTLGPRSQLKRLPVIALKKILNGEEISLVKDDEGNIGGRRWHHVEDVALHTRFILDNQKSLVEKWNSAGKSFTDNYTLCNHIASALNKPLKYNFVKPDRNGHSAHMSISPAKLYSLGWREPYNLKERTNQTVSWYMNNPKWLENV